MTSALISGRQFRLLLGWGTDRFSAAVRSGRFAHLVAVNASSPARTVYVRAKVEAWIAQTPAMHLRPSTHKIAS